MKYNHLLWILPLILMQFSCKKQENSSLKAEKLVIKSEIIGEWIPTKIITEIADNNGLKTITDSSSFVKSYMPGYLITKDYLVTDNRKSSYKISNFGDDSFLEYNIYNIPQKVAIINLNNEILVIKRKEVIGLIDKTETLYFKK